MGFWLFVSRRSTGKNIPESEWDADKYVCDKEFIQFSQLEWIVREPEREVFLVRPKDFEKARAWLKSYLINSSPDARAETILSMLDRMETDEDLWFEPSY